MYGKAETDHYVSVSIFKPPQIFVKGEKRAVVDGFKYGVYTFGFLGIELFSKRSAAESVHEQLGLTKFYADLLMYTKILDIFEKRKFENLVFCTLRKSKIGRKILRLLHNFTLGCMNLNPC